MSRLTLEEAEKVREVYRKTGYPLKRLSEIFNVSISTIANILDNVTYVPLQTSRENYQRR